MKLSILAPVLTMVALAISPVLSSYLDKRHNVQAQFKRPITPANSLARYIEEAELGVKILNDSLIALEAGEPTSHYQSLTEQGVFVLTTALGDATYALKANRIKTEEAQMVGLQLKNLTAHIKPIAAKVGSLKPLFDEIDSEKAKEVSVSLQYLAGSFDYFYQALKGQLYANARQTVASYVLDIICDIDAASTKLDSCTPLTDAKFCSKGDSDWDALPRKCPGMEKCQGSDIRKGLFATYTSGCYEESCRHDDWCKKAEGQDLCKWTPSKWLH